MKGLSIKLFIAIVLFFSLVTTGMYLYEPLLLKYYIYVYRTEQDPKARIKLVDIISKIEQGRKELYSAFRKRCIDEMVKIPSSSFIMKSSNGVRIKRKKVNVPALWMDKYEVTNEKYYVFLKLTGHDMPYEWKQSGFPEDRLDHPVCYVTWDDAKDYAMWLKMDLPTDSEWEYVCRSGWKEPYYKDVRNVNMKKYAWLKDDSNSETHPVGTKAPDRWGIYDMHGNVSEWCRDWSTDDFTWNCPDYECNYNGTSMGDNRVIRGSDYSSSALGSCYLPRILRSHHIAWKDVGFRLCRYVGSDE